MLGALVVATVAPAASANTVSVTAEVAVVEGDPSRTEALAKRAARREAVEQGVGTLVESNSIMRNYELISDEIVTSARGVLSNERWGELQVDGATAKIALTATVSRDAVESSICSVVKANHDPRVALVMVEKSGKESDAQWRIERGVLETRVTQLFQDGCFTMVEPAVNVTEVSANGDIPQSVIDEIVANTQAQYVAVGSGKVIEVVNEKFASTGMKFFSVALNLRLINVDTKTVEAVAEESVQLPGISAIHAVGTGDSKVQSAAFFRRVTDALFQKVATRWTNDLVNASQVRVTVKNVKNYAASKEFQKVAAKLFGKVKPGKLKGGESLFSVDAEGGADEFAAQIEGKTVGKYKVEVLEVMPGKVVLQLN